MPADVGTRLDFEEGAPGQLSDSDEPVHTPGGVHTGRQPQWLHGR